MFHIIVLPVDHMIYHDNNRQVQWEFSPEVIMLIGFKFCEDHSNSSTVRLDAAVTFSIY